ncbi:hypothetical protein K1719_022055 [Acacia pycnantha]|nr:hypothetical protein K1719_022055 [Acacia pycnantha]
MIEDDRLIDDQRASWKQHKPMAIASVSLLSQSFSCFLSSFFPWALRSAQYFVEYWNPHRSVAFMASTTAWDFVWNELSYFRISALWCSIEY